MPNSTGPTGDWALDFGGRGSGESRRNDAKFQKWGRDRSIIIASLSIPASREAGNREAAMRRPETGAKKHPLQRREDLQERRRGQEAAVVALQQRCRSVAGALQERCRSVAEARRQQLQRPGALQERFKWQDLATKARTPE